MSYGTKLNGITSYTLHYGPDPKGEYVANFESLYGGLNLHDLDYRLKAHESPFMENLNWNDGILSSRDGQLWLSDDDTLGRGYTCYQDLCWGYVFLHIGTKLFTFFPKFNDVEMVEIYDGVPEVRGTFFRFQDYLFYKTDGAYLRITNNQYQSFTVEDVVAFVPVTALNCDPTTGGGDSYQPVNRLTPEQTRKYNAASGVKDYVIAGMPSDGVIKKVVVDGVETTAYTYSNGTVHFATAPPVTTPATNNTVEITFTLPSAHNAESIDSCRYAAVFGGNSNICIVFGGSRTQPNAYFWSSNDNLSMNPGYFPDINYNMTNDNNEEITGFGKQQSMLIIFTRNTVGRATFSTEDLDGRTNITMNYVAINSRIGCDLPWTIQLVENNLVFCNTKSGVYILHDSSSAYENNVECISEKINGTEVKHGLLSAVREATADSVCSVDTDRRYTIVVNGLAFEWDYSVSQYSDPSWFRHTNINAVAFFQDVGLLGHMDEVGRVTRMERNYMDYGKPISKKYRFPTMSFGSYDRLKNVNSIILTVRGDTDTTIDLLYSCDYIDRKELVPCQTRAWHLVPRNLTFRSLEVRRYAIVFRRKPGFKHIKHFTMTLENNGTGEDMSIVSAQVFYNFQGRLR